MEPKPNLRVRNLPLILKKRNVAFLKGNFQNKEGHFTPNVKITPLYKEDVLHDTTDVYYLKGEFLRMTLVHRLNIVTKVSRTVAKYFNKDGSVLEKTSDRVTQLLGQEQYKTIFTALCSIIDQELKIRSILALLTVKTEVKIEFDSESSKTFKDKSSQTPDKIDPIKPKPRKRVRRPPGPYIVQDNPDTKKGKKVIVNFCQRTNDSDSTEKDDISVTSKTSSASKIGTTETDLEVQSVCSKRTSTESLQDLGYLHDDYSNHSLGNYSALSDTPTVILTNPRSILNNVDQHTKETENYIVPNFPIRLMDGTDLILPHKPEDVFHIASKMNLELLDPFNRKRLLTHQMIIDHKHCLTVLDEDGNLPIHLAVLNDDLELLSRQCVVLKVRGKSLDILANGLTALQLSLEACCSPALCACLVRHGADPLRAGAAHRAPAHLAAAGHADRLRAVLDTCRARARQILYENEELWTPGMESRSDEELAPILMRHICSMFDQQGYTPLMLASMVGLYENVRIILEHSPESINDKMPTSGNTALFLAVAAACNSSSERGNKSKVVDHFRKTIEYLVENGADPAIENHAGTNVNVLLTEFNCAELSMLVSNKLTQVHLQKSQSTEPAQNCDQLMLVMDKAGNVAYKALANDKKKNVEKKKNKTDVNTTTDIKKEATKDNKPVIVENILLKSPGNTEQISAGVKLNSQIVDATKVKLHHIVLTGKHQNHPEKKKNVLILRNMATPIKTQGKLKRKAADEPKIIKQAKIEK